ncbi:hypothetical protein ES703_44143 [subsurface metagenome]
MWGEVHSPVLGNLFILTMLENQGAITPLPRRVDIRLQLVFRMRSPVDDLIELLCQLINFKLSPKRKVVTDFLLCTTWI